jgi:SOS response regulatory protein OraA/RecX
MNERIKQLKEQSMEWVPNQVDPDTKIRLLNAGKFAELIVRECAEIGSYGHGCIDSELIKRGILEHFGVEE